MSSLTVSLMALCIQGRDASHATQANRRHMLHQMGRCLWQAGYRIPNARGLKPKHVDHLVSEWHKQDLEPGTMKNRMGALRWWADKVEKPGLIAADNETYGVASCTAWKGDKAKVVTDEQLDALPDDRMRVAVRLMQEFGLRTEEALKFQPAYADKDAQIALKGSWCKGGRRRTVPVETDAQRALLDEAKTIAGGGSMIPPDLQYITFRKDFERATITVGLNNLHGLRHGYAQRRYRELSGALPPASGGILRRQLRGEAWQRGTFARRQVSKELGHGRIDVTKAYLG